MHKGMNVLYVLMGSIPFKEVMGNTLFQGMKQLLVDLNLDIKQAMPFHLQVC